MNKVLNDTLITPIRADMEMVASLATHLSRVVTSLTT